MGVCSKDCLHCICGSQLTEHARDTTSQSEWGPVVALHCSGSNGKQWDTLKSTLSGRCNVLAPELLGFDHLERSIAHDTLILEYEALSIISRLSETKGPINLVGHSYGGAIALWIALMIPDRVRSLTLYEPSAFSPLKPSTGTTEDPFVEITGLAASIRSFLDAEDALAAAQIFIEYWGTQDTWTGQTKDQHGRMAKKMPLVDRHFAALLSAPLRLECLSQIDLPTLLIAGRNSPKPSRRVVSELATRLPSAQQVLFSDMGHMGPITHKDVVAQAIADFVARPRSTPLNVPNSPALQTVEGPE